MRRTLIACTVVFLSAAVAASASVLVAHKHRPAAAHGKHHKKTKPGRPSPKPALMIFGNARVEAGVGRAPAGLAEAFPFKDHSRGVATSIRVYIDAQNRAGNLFVGLYSNKDGHPHSRIASGSRRLPKAGAWNAIAIRPVAVRPGRTYWLVLLGERGTLSFRMRSHGACRRDLSDRSHMRSMPSSWKRGPHRSGCPLSAYVIGAAALQNSPVAISLLPDISTPPVISGPTLVGNSLTASPGVWSNAPTGFSYQWQSCNAGGKSCSNILAATGSTYTVAAGELDATLKVVVTATNNAGSGTASSIASGLVGPPGVRVFYISYSSGSDSNSGTSMSAPWQHAPGMNGCTASCASYAPATGDRFIFEGGDTWPNSAFPLMTESGLPLRSDYYGIETDWHTGPSFTPPIFSAGGSNITGHSDALDGFIDTASRDYVEVDGIQFTGWTASGLASGATCAVVDLGTDTNVTINRVLVTGMSIDSSGDAQQDNCAVALGNPNPPFGGSSILENSTITGGGNTYGIAAWMLANVENNAISGLPGMIYPAVPTGGTGTISGNLMYDCGYPSFPSGASNLHADMILVDVTGNPSTLYVHDNVLYNTNSQGGGECESMWLSNPGESDYVWNNVLYNLRGSGPLKLGDLSSTNGTAFVWDNTLEGAWDGTSSPNTSCVEGAHGTMVAVTVQNNLCVTNSGGISSGLTGSDTVGNNVVLTTSQANNDVSRGLLSNSPFQYALTGGSSPGVGAGANLSTDCSGALASVCSDTTYAGARSTVSRPGTTGWDAGAYQAP